MAATTTEDLKVVIAESCAPETPSAGVGSTPKTPGSAASPRSKLTSPFMPQPGMDPREVDFWPPQRYKADNVDFSRSPQDWDIPLLLRQVVEHKRVYPLDSVTFREYLTGFYTEENIDFLLELSRLRREIMKDKDPRVPELLAFFEKYMKPSGSKSANISSAALNHVQSILDAGERSIEIRDFHLANRDIADLLIRGPYLKDFFRVNLGNTNANEVKSDVYFMFFFGSIAATGFALTVLYSYWYVFLTVYFIWAFSFTTQKYLIGICPVLTLYHDGYRLRPSAQFWHCNYMNEHLQKVEDPDVLAAQRKSSRRQMMLTNIVTVLFVVGSALIRYFLIEQRG